MINQYIYTQSDSQYCAHRGILHHKTKKKGKIMLLCPIRFELTNFNSEEQLSCFRNKYIARLIGNRSVYVKNRHLKLFLIHNNVADETISEFDWSFMYCNLVNIQAMKFLATKHYSHSTSQHHCYGQLRIRSIFVAKLQTHC